MNNLPNDILYKIVNKLEIEKYILLKTVSSELNIQLQPYLYMYSIIKYKHKHNDFIKLYINVYQYFKILQIIISINSPFILNIHKYYTNPYIYPILNNILYKII